jgi:hypothetical protein
MEAFIAAVAFWPLIVTKVTDFVRNAVDPGGTFPRFTWNLVPFALGVVIAVVYELQYSDLIPNLPPRLIGLSGFWNEFITGLGIAAVSSAWHELLDALSGVAKRQRAS